MTGFSDYHVLVCCECNKQTEYNQTPWKYQRRPHSFYADREGRRHHWSHTLVYTPKEEAQDPAVAVDMEKQLKKMDLKIDQLAESLRKLERQFVAIQSQAVGGTIVAEEESNGFVEAAESA